MADDIALNKAAIIERSLERLEQEYRGREDQLDSNQTRQDAIILNLQRACEAAIDLAMHVVRVRRLGIPQQSRQAFQFMREAGLLEADLERRMHAMVGFRNIAVHQYQQIDIAIVRAILEERLDDFNRFISAVLRAD